MAGKTDAKATAAKPVPGGYSACVYVHGMGSQRRYEETSRLIDRIDAHVGRDPTTGMLVGIDAMVEPNRDPERPDVSFLRSTLRVDAGSNAGYHPVRFYEIYWAPVMAGQKSISGVLKWMLLQVWRPVVTLGSPWRERARLRRSTLVALFDRRRPPPPGALTEDFSALMALYDSFEQLDARGDYPDGTFADFISFIAAQASTDGAQIRRLTELSRRWREAYQLHEARNFLALLTITLALVLLAGAAVVSLYQLLQLALAALPQLPADITETLKTYTGPTAAISLFVSIAMLFGAGKFLTDFLGDVQAWATFEETDEKFERRTKVINAGCAMLAHVLGDPKCDRVTVVAHSLGTTIAHDILLALARQNRARTSDDYIVGPVPLTKIEAFVTMGSPIDKIEYFFESYVTASHRYKRYVETLRGDLATVPFTRNKKPYVHWINFWDDADPVSGSLQSPADRKGQAQRIDNVHVRCLSLPIPGRSHGAYFNDSRVIDTLYRVIFLRDFSFRTVKLKDEPGTQRRFYDYDSAYFDVVNKGSADPVGERLWWKLIAAAVPWLALFSVISWIAGERMPAIYAASVAGGIAVLLVGAFVVGSWQPPRYPIRKRITSTTTAP